MVDPRKANFNTVSMESDSSRFFSEFPRIQVKPKRNYQEPDFKSLPSTERQELLSRLIDHVRDL